MPYAELNAAELLRACLDTRQAAAWAEFVRRYQPTLAGVIGRIVSRYSMGNPALVDDLVQDTYLRLCRNDCKVLREFVPEHEESIFGFLKVIASSVALDHFRAQAAAKRGPDSEALDQATERFAVSRATAADVAAENAEVWRFVEQAAQSERDLTIFRLHHQQGFSAAQIAALPSMGLTDKGVESCLHRLLTDLRRRLRVSPVRKGKTPQISFGGMQ